MVALLIGVFVVAIAATILRSPEGVIVSADPGHTPRPVPLLLVPIVLAGLSSVGPFSAGAPSVWPPPVVLLVAAVGTAISAGLGEELMYRGFLQTRLEALLGSWTGLLLASLLFGLMHATSHGEGPLWASAAQAVAMQGTTGIALGMMWRRWRRLWVCVLAHVLLNGLVVLLHLLGVLG